MLPILVLMIDSDRFVTNFGPKNHATWPFLSMPWAVIRGWAIIQVWAINREFTVAQNLQKFTFCSKFQLTGGKIEFCPSVECKAWYSSLIHLLDVHMKKLFEIPTKLHLVDKKKGRRQRWILNYACVCNFGNFLAQFSSIHFFSSKV